MKRKNDDDNAIAYYKLAYEKAVEAEILDAQLLP